MQLQHITLGDSSHHNDLIIIHGLYGSSSNWRSLGARYAQDRRVHALDLRNHGRSPWNSQHDYIALANDINEFVQTNNIQQYDLMGHSMGGKTAMIVALLHPEKLDKLVVADIAPVTYEDNEHDDFIQAMRMTASQQPQSRQDADTILSQYVSSAAIRQFFLQNILFEQEDNTKKAKWRINLDAIEQNLDHILGFPYQQIMNRQYMRSSLFIYGGNSNYVLAEHKQSIKHYFPTAEYHCIENAGHWLHAEKADEFFQYTQAFLTK